MSALLQRPLRELFIHQDLVPHVLGLLSLLFEEDEHALEIVMRILFERVCALSMMLFKEACVDISGPCKNLLVNEARSVAFLIVSWALKACCQGIGHGCGSAPPSLGFILCKEIRV